MPIEVVYFVQENPRHKSLAEEIDFFALKGLESDAQLRRALDEAEILTIGNATLPSLAGLL